MKYYFGIDGGGTKTLCYIGNEDGNILGRGKGGKCNYQLCGIEVAKQSIDDALNAALKEAGIYKEQLTYGVLGLSGADEEVDFNVLNNACNDLLLDIPFEVMNDTWIGLRAGAPYGVASICGTGAAHAGVDKDGNHVILRNLDYELGNYGGGGEVVEKAMHFAFRSNEGTYKKSGLEEMLLDLFEVGTMDAVSDMYRTNGLSEAIEFEIPKRVFALAKGGDEVAVEIIRDMGQTEGMFAAAVIKKLGLEEEKVPLVLIGSLFGTDNDILIGAYMKEVKKTAPYSEYIIPNKEPAYGALMLAVEKRN